MWNRIIFFDNTCSLAKYIQAEIGRIIKNESAIKLMRMVGMFFSKQTFNAWIYLWKENCWSEAMWRQDLYLFFMLHIVKNSASPKYVVENRNKMFGGVCNKFVYRLYFALDEHNFLQSFLQTAQRFWHWNFLLYSFLFFSTRHW